MKTFLKILGTTALLASVVPFAYKKDEAADQETLQALLWKLTRKSDPTDADKHSVVLEFGFNNPFAKGEAHLFTDELTVDYDAPAGDAFPEDEVVVEAPIDVVPPVEPAAPETPDAPEAPEADGANDAPKGE